MCGTPNNECKVMNRIYNKEQERGGVMGYSIKTKLKEIMKSEAAMDVLEKYVPGVKQNPQLKLGASMPIDVLAKMAPDMLPPEKLPEMDADLKAIEE
jgi:hypothetical protein